MADSYSTLNKALIINQDQARYGTFAEIGAGQEVARYFFKAGLASQTVAKTMSAYDMTFSDAIYGPEPGKRYVCESRVHKMLNYEMGLLQERLNEQRGKDTAFFVYAATVTTGSDSERSHGWLGVQFQTRPGGPINTAVMHVWMRDRFRLEQQESLGTLGVNLIFAALYFNEEPKLMMRSLHENLKSNRVEIDMIRFDGPDLKHIDNRLMSLELLQQGYTHLVMFDDNGNVQQPSEALYNRPVFVQRGTFRPVTNVNARMMEAGLNQFEDDFDCVGQTAVFMEMTMSRLRSEGQVDEEDFLARVDTINTLGHAVLISDYNLYMELNIHLRRLTRKPIGLILGAGHLPLIFDDQYYDTLKGGVLEGMGRVFHGDTHFYIYPYKGDGKHVTASQWAPEGALARLYDYIRELGQIRDIDPKEPLKDSIPSLEIRKMIESGDSTWEERVPTQVVEMIKEKKLFSYGEKKC